jgi:hypothetical protein
MNTQTHTFYKGWFTTHGVRGRLSFIGALALQIITVMVAITVIMIFKHTEALDILWGYMIGLVVIGWLTICVMIQRIRHCVGPDSFKILLLFLVSILIPFVSMIWLVYPGQTHTEAPRERIAPTL